MPVIYISKEHYDKLIKIGKEPKTVIKEFLDKYLQEQSAN